MMPVSAHVLMEWQDLNVTSVPMDFMDIRMAAVHECNCSTDGSSSLQCDLTTGQCVCRKEFAGQTCNTCLFGYRNYPSCISCDCDVKGTQSAWCDDKQKMCSCEEATGNCACK
ncbi:hypothetical protein AB205_0171190, partial [Aquarana catesbeiana]